MKTLTLTPAEKKQIRTLADDLERKKAILGDAIYRLMGVGAFTIIQQIQEAEALLKKSGEEIARAHGLDPDDPSKGTFTLNTDELTLTPHE